MSASLPTRDAATQTARSGYHDDLPDIFEPLPAEAHLRWAFDSMGIETPGELIDDAPVVLRRDGELHRAWRTRADDRDGSPEDDDER